MKTLCMVISIIIMVTKDKFGQKGNLLHLIARCTRRVRVVFSPEQESDPVTVLV